MKRLMLVACVCGGCVYGDALGQTVVRGPVQRGESRYYLIEAANWSAARGKALAMGGELAKIDDAAENEWIRTNLFTTGTKAFIGLNDAAQEGVFAWSGGGESSYRNWNGGSSGNSGSSDYAYMESTGGTWLMAGATYTPYAIVEVTGPIRLPGEFATLALAAPHIGVVSNEVELAAGDIQKGTVGAIALPAGKRIKVRGQGAGVSRLVLGSGVEQTELSGTWDLSELSLVGAPGSHPIFRLYDGAYTFRQVEVTCTPGTLMTGVVMVDRGASLTASRSKMHGMTTTPFVFLEQSLPSRFEGCLFTDIEYFALMLLGGADVTLSNCTVAGMPENYVPVFYGSGSLSIDNSIVWWVSSQLFHGGLEVEVRYSNTATPVPGEGNISVFPDFVSGTDFRLRPGSASIDAANVALQGGSALDLDGLPRLVDDPSAPNAAAYGLDMGCHESQEAGCAADFDGSGFVDLDDFAAFVASFESGC
ncbi:MAG TPA: lectin-like protein [Phycisphaerales bacterium]|nr:lectin-like protein [Phycisphaerales bacterium]